MLKAKQTFFPSGDLAVTPGGGWTAGRLLLKLVDLPLPEAFPFGPLPLDWFRIGVDDAGCEDAGFLGQPGQVEVNLRALHRCVPQCIKRGIRSRLSNNTRSACLRQPEEEFFVSSFKLLDRQLGVTWWSSLCIARKEAPYPLLV